MPSNVKVDVHHITRVEGHGNIKVDVSNGELKVNPFTLSGCESGMPF